jgi:hypothetical protein
MRPLKHLHRRTLAILVSVIVFPAFAHHGDAGRFTEEVIDLTGTVVTLMFINPHSQLVVDVTDENGETLRWHAEFSNPTRMNSEFGWTRDILKPGDRVTLTGRQLKSGAPFINLTERAQVVMTDTGEQIFRTRNFVSAEPNKTP